jgi:predicted nucleotidyltransferase component of viral defense system
MRLSIETLTSISQSTGYGLENIEKAALLLDILNALTMHPALKEQLVLKGGTALNLFLLDMPRLSIDIDLNYIGTADRDEMLAQRPLIEQAIAAVLSRQGFAIKRAPVEHAGGKWRAGYTSAMGQAGNLEIDINFVYRIPLWNVQKLNSQAIGPIQARQIPIVDIHELAAGKLAALFSRTRARDIYDIARLSHLLEHGRIKPERLRIAFVVFGAASRIDWRSITIDDISLSAGNAKRELLPVVRKAEIADKDFAGFANALVVSSKEFLREVLPFSPEEEQFLSLLLDTGKIDASLLTSDSDLKQKISRHPLLNWKALNVLKHHQQNNINS